MPFSIVRQDITRMQVDAIVNAANTELKMGGGVCGAIFQAAGAEALQAACPQGGAHSHRRGCPDARIQPARQIHHPRGGTGLPKLGRCAERAAAALGVPGIAQARPAAAVRKHRLSADFKRYLRLPQGGRPPGGHRRHSGFPDGT